MIVKNKHGFHTKVSFRQGHKLNILMGSSNSTSAALTINKEWNTLVEEDLNIALRC